MATRLLRKAEPPTGRRTGTTASGIGYRWYAGRDRPCGPSRRADEEMQQ